LIYSFDRAAAKQNKAQQLIRQTHTLQEGVVRNQVVPEFLSTVPLRFAHPKAVPEVEQHLTTVFRQQLGPLRTFDSFL
jgi:hypothetical protein